MHRRLCAKWDAEQELLRLSRCFLHCLFGTWGDSSFQANCDLLVEDFLRHIRGDMDLGTELDADLVGLATLNPKP